MTSFIKALVVAVIVATTLSACSFEPPRSPNDAGIPESRADAQSQIDAVASRLDYSGSVTVLGTGQADSCDVINNWWFNDVDEGYRCWMTWTSILVLPSEHTPSDIAAAVDDEMAALDVPYFAGGMVRSLMSLYPDQRQPDFHVPVSTGGVSGGLQFTVEVEQFRPELWRDPSRQGRVSTTGDLTEITAATVQATGATEVVTVSMLVEYWNTEGTEDLGQGPAPDSVNWVTWSFGDAYAFELAEGSPADAAEACLTDPAIDAASVTRLAEPFSYLRFELLPTAQSIDAQRIRDCIKPRLSSGTLVELSPYE